MNGMIGGSMSFPNFYGCNTIITMHKGQQNCE